MTWGEDSGAAGRGGEPAVGCCVDARDSPCRPRSAAADAAAPLPADLGMLTVCLIWGLNFSVTKWRIAQIPPLAFTAIRFLARRACCLWLILRLAEGKPSRCLDRRWFG